MTPATPATPDQYRQLEPLLRRLIADEAEATSLRQLSLASGVDLASLSRFRSGGSLHLETIDRLLRHFNLLISRET